MIILTKIILYEKAPLRKTQGGEDLKSEGKGLDNCGTRTQVVAAVAEAAPADPELVEAPAAPRNIAIGVARTGAEGDVLDVQVFAGLPEVEQLQDDALQ
ncbi:MAG: hypothetical protein COU29_02685 [Candidatus Magasanikbacteria bacterium CG10_big_fil_rev_8_21_14_0_10_36_32]|uniref:Uncharacterized protein n=1 Tax=Candidatus Magasanikbacteria bacterium CG10_big_fil_rev_8_21_14_0_10_36_32 TaxID=1974646 RepID=A0A2M6W772_9BACT|nr:MAG: hypothetical protein COU29_02685 [Candidatus Magasanikbacteria bacterium CG10_big_fil_rev_8_21_14_0_10_36_32]